ncbi:MAG TPA: class I SAM-dependent methyltransferase [Burkholderiaceae bacterium]|mgnify:CR=1 FL=1|nr:class I SAM-dependent methyltransferase [Burkholderiaceae bacterium]
MTLEDAGKPAAATAFSGEWLALREPFDSRARAATPVERSSTEITRLVDLGCGTGANLRHLAPRLGGRQHWHLIDHDPLLLAQVAPRLQRWARRRGWRFTDSAASAPMAVSGDGFDARITLRRLDLAADPAGISLAGVQWVTTSALLDLVSAGWLQRLVDHCARHRAAVHWALSYDGRITWSPADPLDEAVTDALNRHQLGDKGFGSALGPAAASVAQQSLQAAGYVVRSHDSPWTITAAGVGARILGAPAAAYASTGGGADTDADADADADALQAALIDGWTAAAIETDGTRRDDYIAWAARRRRWSSGGTSVLRVGHRDLIAVPGL